MLGWPLKIKVVGKEKKRGGRDTAAAKPRRMGVGSTARVRHCFAEGLWEFEGDDGQTYLAVMAKPWRPGREATWTADLELPPVPPPVSLPRRRTA
jgi:hypothetical protein